MSIVVKLGGRVQGDPRLGGAVRELQAAAGPLCIVHGGGDEVSALQRQMGREPVFINGRRVTTQEDLEILRMVLSGVVNKRLVSLLQSAGIRAAGISGEDGGLISAATGADQLGRAGRPVGVNTEIVTALQSANFLPVISPVARDAESKTGEALNVNGDDAAAAIAAALGAELWLIADVAGVMDENGATLPGIDQATMDSLVASGAVSRGMHAKLEAGFGALAAGSPAVRVASIEAFSDPYCGTLLSLTPSMK